MVPSEMDVVVNGLSKEIPLFDSEQVVLMLQFELLRIIHFCNIIFIFLVADSFM